VGVSLLGEVERGIFGIEVLRPLGSIGQAGHFHPAEYSDERAVVPRLHTAVCSAITFCDAVEADLACRAHEEMVLEELAEQVAGLFLEVCFEYPVLEVHGLGIAEERHDGPKALG
jgi:hypothetical protein